jgi:hypothetical protein
VVERDYTPYQQKVIKRYYDNQPTILRQRLAELVGNLFLAEGAKRTKLWKEAEEVMTKIGVPAARVAHVVQKADPQLLAQVVKELEAG